MLSKGVGKTRTAGAVLMVLLREGQLANGALIVAPLSTLEGWKREFQTIGPDANIKLVNESAKNAGMHFASARPGDVSIRFLIIKIIKNIINNEKK
jgi:SNF2 family DNA or RNA helicase